MSNSVCMLFMVNVIHYLCYYVFSMMESIMGKNKQKSVKDMIPFFKEDPCCADM